MNSKGEAVMPSFDKTPDLLVKDEGRIKVAIEYKATKLTFAAQHSDPP